MAILAKKMIFQRSTTFFAHFAIFIFLISFFFYSYPPTPRLLAAQAPNPQKTDVFGARMLMRHTQFAHNRKIEYSCKPRSAPYAQ